MCYFYTQITAGAVPVVVLTKADLAEEQEPYIRCVERVATGVKLRVISSRSGLGMWDIPEGLGEAFADVEQYIGRCRFSNCSHLSEPGCAIKDAILSGELSEERWESYCKLKREAKYSDIKDIRMKEKQKRKKGFVKKSDRTKSNRID